MATHRIGHWPLRTDCLDATSQGCHGEPQAITFQEGAVFNGINSSITLPRMKATSGARPFSLSLEFKIDDDRGFLPGGLCSRYDYAKMEGWHLSVLTQAGVTTTQSNWRNLQFGWSTHRAADTWKDLGSPGNSRFICALCVHHGNLYAGTFDAAKDRRGRVYRLGHDETWIDCGSPDESNSVFALTEFKGRLYAGTSRYKASGSKIENSPNFEPGGKIFRYEGGQTWTLFAELPVPDNDSVGAMTVYKDRLIAMPLYPYGVFAYDEDGHCEILGAPGPNSDIRTITMAPYQGKLFIGCNGGEGVYSRFMQGPWAFNGKHPKGGQVYCFSVFHDQLLIGYWPEARMFRYEGGQDWSDLGLMGAEKESMAVSVFNGNLYAGTLPGGYVYRYTANKSWVLSGVLEEYDPAFDYRRVWSMAVYKGQLFAGTLPSGKVWSLRNDPLATYDYSLSSSWHHATITYDLKQLCLYTDGKCVSSANFPDSGVIDLSEVPLVIGRGPQCHFSGRIREIEIFDSAMSADEVSELNRE